MMSAHSDILLDFNHMMADRIGPSGILRAEIASLEPQMRQISDGLNDLRRLGQLPFRDLPTRLSEGEVHRIIEKAKDVRDRFQTILLLGVGGSSLGAQFLAQTQPLWKRPELIICDYVDGERWKEISEHIDYKKTLLMVVSKSGKTIETLSAFLFFSKCLKDTLGDQFRDHVMIITDPQEGPLRKIACEEKIPSFEIPPGVGGRFSILTPVGLFPAACLGMDIPDLLAGAHRMDERCRNADPWGNPALMSAVLQFLFDTKKKRRIRVIMPYGERLKGYAGWFAQLWAESLGKRMSLKGKEIFSGSTPICASGPQDQHSQLQLYLDGPQDKTVTFIASEGPYRLSACNISAKSGDVAPMGGYGGGESGFSPPFEVSSGFAGANRTGDLKLVSDTRNIPELSEYRGKSAAEILEAERLATEKALADSGRPSQTILLKEITPHTIGQLLYMAEMETVYAGELYNVNPFDQPAVDRIKLNIGDFLSGRLTEKKDRSYFI